MGYRSDIRIVTTKDGFEKLKEFVKKYLEENTYTLLEEASDLKEARTLINANIENLDNDIGNIFKENNYDWSSFSIRCCSICRFRLLNGNRISFSSIY